MIAMTNANMKNLPTTPSPPPQKSWDKRDRAVSAAIKELGPQAIHEFDFTVYKCDGRWMWRATAANERPPVSAQQIKANGGKIAAAATLADQQRVKDLTKPADTHAPDARERAKDEEAGNAVFAAAIQKKIADKIAAELKGTPAEKLALEIAGRAGERLNKAKIDQTDKGGIPVFLKREGDNSAEAQKALIERHKKTTGPDRQIKNPPNVAQTKAKAKKEKKTSIAFVAKSAILAGKDNTKALAEVLAVFPNCGYKESDIQWYRRKLVKEGKLKDESPKAKKAK